jgi:hypothetical protein
MFKKAEVFQNVIEYVFRKILKQIRVRIPQNPKTDSVKHPTHSEQVFKV